MPPKNSKRAPSGNQSGPSSSNPHPKRSRSDSAETSTTQKKQKTLFGWLDATPPSTVAQNLAMPTGQSAAPSGPEPVASSDLPGDASESLSKTRYSDWLNSLNDDEAHRLYAGLVEFEDAYFLSEPLYARFLTVSSRTARDGRWWLEWLRCEISTLSPNKAGGSGAGRAGHPRHRIVVPKGFVSKVGQGREYRVVCESVSKDHLAAFHNLEKADVKSDVRQVRIHAHHIAYNASRASDGYKPLEIGLEGRQISHYCDRVGCVRAEHMSHVDTQAENNSRQKCSGAIIVVDDHDSIVREQLCRHAQLVQPSIAQIDEAGLATCCRRLTIVNLGEMWPELRDSLWGSQTNDND